MTNPAEVARYLRELAEGGNVPKVDASILRAASTIVVQTVERAITEMEQDLPEDEE